MNNTTTTTQLPTLTSDQAELIGTISTTKNQYIQALETQVAHAQRTITEIEEGSIHFLTVSADMASVYGAQLQALITIAKANQATAEWVKVALTDPEVGARLFAAVLLEG